MKRFKTSRKSMPSQTGFSLIEMLIVILLLSIIMGSVFQQVTLIQKRYRSEENKLDVFQTAREFIDQMVRDIHQAGFPNKKMYAASTFAGPPEQSDLNAIGIVEITPTKVRFEGDVDGDGFVDTVAYNLITNTTAAGNQNCPCLRRSQLRKANGTDPFDQIEDYRTQVENVTTDNRTIFTAYDSAGAQVDLGAGLQKTLFNPSASNYNSDPVNRIWTIQIQLNVRAAIQEVGLNFRPQVFLTATAQVNN